CRSEVQPRLGGFEQTVDFGLPVGLALEAALLDRSAERRVRWAIGQEIGKLAGQLVRRQESAGAYIVTELVAVQELRSAEDRVGAIAHRFWHTGFGRQYVVEQGQQVGSFRVTQCISKCPSRRSEERRVGKESREAR